MSFVISKGNEKCVVYAVDNIDNHVVDEVEGDDGQEVADVRGDHSPAPDVSPGARARTRHSDVPRHPGPTQAKSQSVSDLAPGHSLVTPVTRSIVTFVTAKYVTTVFLTR